MIEYRLECRGCGAVSDHDFQQMDPDKAAACPGCGARITVSDNRIWDNVRLTVVTESTGCNYSGYDVGLDKYITSKEHRRVEMEKSGVVDYSPDTEMKKVTDERRYISEHSRPSEPEARKALHDLSKSASTTLKKRAIKRAFDKVPLPKLPEF